jgi:hypothetical protein
LKAEEVDYNLGRGFQQLGIAGFSLYELTPLIVRGHLGLQAFAQKHYQAVLESVEKRRNADVNASVRYLYFSRS